MWGALISTGLAGASAAGDTGANAKKKALADEAAWNDRSDKLHNAQDAFYDTSKSDAFQSDLDSRLAAYAARKAPTVGAAKTYGGAGLGAAKTYAGATIGRTDDLAVRAKQTALLDQLAAQAEGKGPSLATQQMKAGVDAQLAAYMAAQGSARGRVNPALAGKTLATQNASALQAGARDAAMARIQEQLAARQQLAGLSSSIREQDIGVAAQQASLDQQAGMFNAQQGNQFSLAYAGFQQQAGLANMDAQNKMALANLEAQLRAQGMNDAAIMQILASKQQQMNLDRQMTQDYWRMVTGENGRAADRQMQWDMYQQKRSDQQMAALAQGVGTIAGAVADYESKTDGEGKGKSTSDRRAKKNVHPGGPALAKFFEQLGAHAYEYRDAEKPGRGKGTFVSPMAQELERTELGKSAVSVDADGTRVVDYGKLGGMTLAGLAEQYRRTKDLDARVARLEGSKGAKASGGRAR